MKMLNEWLTERLQQSLSAYQLTSISFIVKVSVILMASKLYDSDCFRKFIRTSSCMASMKSVSTPKPINQCSDAFNLKKQIARSTIRAVAVTAWWAAPRAPSPTCLQWSKALAESCSLSLNRIL